VDVAAAPVLSAADAPTALNVVISGPDRARVGDLVDYTITIANTSNVPLTRLRIVNVYEPSLFPKNAADGFVQPVSRGELVWNVGQLPPGERVTLGVRYECLQASNAAGCRVSVGTAEGAQSQQAKSLQILPADRPAAREGVGLQPGLDAAEAPPEQVVGELKVQVADRKNPIALNETTTYIIVIENARNVSDKNVKLTISIPPGMEFVKLSGPVVARGQSPDGRTIEATPIAEMRAGEILKPFYVEARGMRIGKHTLKVRVDSFRSPQAVEAAKDTTVNVSG
jgi:uncharacterized repeat protein (TIGR01451 family)